MKSNKVALSAIRPNPVALRTVDKESEAFESLRDTMSDPDIGLLNPISVQEKKDTETGDKYYELLDGLHRYTAASDLGWSDIAVNLVSVNGKELAAQIIANVHKVDTKPIDYTNQMKRIFASDPLMTMSDMSKLVKKSPKWVEERLGLLKLHPSLQSLVNEGTIKLGNAHALAKLPAEEQLNYADAAQLQSAEEFAPTVEARIKELRQAARQGRDASTPEFIPQAHCRKMNDTKSEIENPNAAAAVLAAENAQTLEDAWVAALKWALNIDKISATAAKAKWDAKQAEAAESKETARKDREARNLVNAQFTVLKAKVGTGTATEDEVAAYEAQVAERAAAKAAVEAAKAAEAVA